MPQPAKRRPTALITSAVLAASLLLAGCGADANEHATNPDQLEAVSVHEEENKMTVELDQEIDSGDTATRVIEAGDGEDVNDGDLLVVKTVVADAKTGEMLAGDVPSSQLMKVTKDDAQGLTEEIYNLVENSKLGSTLAVHVPSQQTGGQGGQLLIVKLEKKTPTKIEGEVKPMPEGLPEITEKDNGEPEIAKPTGDAPKETVAEIRKEGDGREIAKDDAVLVNYKGIKWSDGEVFDSSWERGAPVPFGLSQVVKGWSEGLTGVKEGSQVVLVVPPKDGYGDSKGHELEKETLVFVVDILHSEPLQQPQQPPQPEPEQ
ncbi:FKBP-type peptidyl-prolyl cis-trans isomerase [Micrococcoides hystricis]|uniref:Peptidyl-prolyl cis-trans isomerase n=1 Tax=Micrococcoides hystricis TaxID=1572761 RepID=A0ABV6P795_9MICC